jgi:hypothetical protein
VVIYADTKYNPGDRVMCKFKDQNPGEISEGVIKDVEVYHFGAHREDHHMIYYWVEPFEMVGFEHDDHERLFEEDILGLAPEQREEAAA